jgi:hypothetical protein
MFVRNRPGLETTRPKRLRRSALKGTSDGNRGGRLEDGLDHRRAIGRRRRELRRPHGGQLPDRGKVEAHNVWVSIVEKIET